MGSLFALQGRAMSRTTRTPILSLAATLSLLLAACVVQATDPPGASNNNGGGADAGVGGGADGGGGGGGGDGGGGGGGADAGITPTQLLTDFGGCMTIADWDANNLGQLALTQTDADGPCSNCHSNGEHGTYLNADSATTFSMAKTYPYVMRYASVDSQLQLSASIDLVNAGKLNGHPTYTLPAALVTGITNFFDATNAHYLAGTCTP